MKTMLSIVAIAASLLTAAPASATLITFEDIGAEPTVRNGYNDLNWENFDVIHRLSIPGTGYEAGVVSGNYGIFNAWSQPAAITAVADTFSFNSAWFTAAWSDDNLLVIEGFTDGDAIADYTVTLALNTRTPLFFDAQWADLQRLSFRSTRNQFVMDDLRINETATTEVPEPLTIGLLGMGLLGVAGARRRRKG